MRTLLGLLILLLIVALVLLYTGFWRADVSGGSLPKVTAEGGSLPSVDVDTKEVVVGTEQKQIDVPKVKTEKETITVPVVNVKEAGEE
jgi:hypothetical protein